MRRFKVFVAVAATLALSVCQGGDWNRFRGPNGSGVSETPVPVTFSENENLKWRVELPGRGVSSPIVVGSRVFVTCYSGYGVDRRDPGKLEDLKRHLVCIDRAKGEITWTKTVPVSMPEDPYSGAGVPAHGYASHTPTSDGERVYAFFGKSGVVAFDLDGNKLWQKDVGKESGRMRWGSSSSPIVHKNTVIVTASDESESIRAFDGKTGEELWKAEAAGLGSVWGTPALAETDSGTEVVIAVPGEIWGLDATNGKLKWYAPGNEGASHNVVVSDGVAYSIGGGRGGSNGVAVRVGGKGEVASSDLLWENRASGRFATPLVYDGKLFQVTGDRVACYSAKTGETLYQGRLAARSTAPAREVETSQEGRQRGQRSQRGGGGRSSDYASPVIAGGRLYIPTASGRIFVLGTGSEFEILATNDMTFDTSGFSASPAVSDGQLFLRSNTHLYCISE